MRCDSIREALSALLDGEDPGLDRASVDEHLRACPGCRYWGDDAARINHLAALGPFGHEATAFNVAIGVALLWIAAKPRTARGPVPLLAVFVLALTWLSVLDLVTGEVGWQRLASHLPAATGLLLTGVLARLHPAPDPVPGHTSGDNSAGHQRRR